ncbi:hypothetical protein BJ508DRAFT_410136 [Ascobolus immersus RN42]|uniref:Uncharacterized protein n=1 Tax=Ascobolus immersus RN42 TaxID=1160509 RepID=A0A3N4IQQ6_ASCIM|nr:hypothetical protein BJ508DRAFT_410136 [Ascobolus immersus RN42]
MSEQKKPAISHGRGGQGNIGHDDTQYVDGEIHRQEDPSQTGHAYSTGRGGGGNIGTPKAGVSPALRPQKTAEDAIPDVARVPIHEGEYYHSGRGGQGNAFIPGEEAKRAKDEVKAEKAGKPVDAQDVPKGLADKIKNRLSRIFGSK